MGWGASVMSVDFKNLETFLTVATLGSFRKAAEQLHATQPAISQRISQLEESLGARLLVRESRTVTPTPRGRDALIYAEKLLALRAELINAVGETSAIEGSLRIGVAETIVHTWLPIFIQQVSTVFPRLSLEIEVDISPNLRERLLNREIDLAFLMEGFAVDPLSSKPLCSHRLAFIASPQLAPDDKPMTLHELARHPIMTFSRRTKPYKAVYDTFNQPDLPRVRINASASLATLVHMAEVGLGIAAIPPAIVRHHLKDGRLKQIETGITFPPVTFRAAWLPGIDSRATEKVAEIASDQAAIFQPF